MAHYSAEQAETLERNPRDGDIPKIAICTLTNKGGIPLTNNLLASLIKSEMMSKNFIHIFCTDNYSQEYYEEKGYINARRVKYVECEEEHSDFSTKNFRNVTRNKLPAIKDLLLKDYNVIYIDNDTYVRKKFHIDMLNLWYGNNEDESTHKLILQDDRPKVPFCTSLISIIPDPSNIILVNKAIEAETKNPHWGDQMSFVKTLSNNPDLIQDTKCAPFPGELFPNGFRMKNDQYDKENFILANANYVCGMKDKIDLLKLHGCWLENAEEIIS
tara:strand:- start:1931 stop:2746 length:816 start_codon:yes stop_codon:yes gene_type:complete